MTTETVENEFLRDPIIPNRAHPIVEVLQGYDARVQEMGAQLDTLGSISNAEMLRVVGNYCGSLPGNLARLGDFGVSPSDLLGIWEQVGNTFAGFDTQERIKILYHLGRLIINCHGVADSEELGGLPGFYFQSGAFPKEIKQNQAGLVQYAARVREVMNSLDVLRAENMTPLIERTTDIFGNALSPLVLRLQSFRIAF